MVVIDGWLSNLLLLVLLLSPTAFGARKPKDAVLLSDVKALTFRKAKLTTHRRVSALPQLKCTGGSARGLFEPETMRCTNTGSSYSSGDVEWTCTASIPPEFKLGSTDVICEGYAGPDDEYVLKGSCGVEYRLVLTERGEEVYGKRKSDGKEGRDSAAILFWIFFLGVAGWMIYAAFWRNRRTARADREGAGGFRRGGGGGGGGGGSDDDPPPPYTPRKPYTSSPRKSDTTRPPRSYTSNYTTSSTQEVPPPPQAAPQAAAGARGWRPGFWTGAATGFAATRMFNQTRNNAPPQMQQAPGWGGFGGGGGWGAGPSGSSGRRQDRGEGSSSSSGSSSYSSSRYESSGFGSTSRR